MKSTLNNNLERMITPNNEVETSLPPSRDEAGSDGRLTSREEGPASMGGGGSGRVGEGSGRVGRESGLVGRGSGVGPSRGNARTASRGVTFSSPESLASPHRWDSQQQQRRQQPSASSSYGSPRKKHPQYGDNDTRDGAIMSLTDKAGPRVTGSGKSAGIQEKLEKGWKKETYR